MQHPVSPGGAVVIEDGLLVLPLKESVVEILAPAVEEHLRARIAWQEVQPDVVKDPSLNQQTGENGAFYGEIYQ